jgi:diguanylate cyclase (GGDEF)-like protein
VYTRQVVRKLKQDGFGAHLQSQVKPGYVPLPAQFLKLFGKQASEESDGLFRYQPISKWNLEPSQGLDDEFERWAWGELEKQDQENPEQPIKWQPAWRFEEVAGVMNLRYLRADPASADSCVNCHNQQEQSLEVMERRYQAGFEPGKQWKKNQLLGAIQVSIPLDKIESVAARQTSLITLVIVVIFGSGLLAIAYFVIRDLLRTQQAAEEMSWRANHDDLTGLASRLAFEHRASELLLRCRDDNSTHALMFLDLDQFKIVNDTCGHIAGDELLCQIATTMGSNIRSNDMLARLGGDEFGVLLEGCDIDNAYDCAEKLRRAIRDINFSKGSRKFEIGVSIGLVAVNNNCEDVTSMLSLADLACYTAKDEGRNRIKVYSDSDTQIDIRHEEMEWASRFNRAIEENRLKLAVQHSTCLNSEKDHTYSEVLLRMVDAHGQLIPTSVFISAAERYHFMPTIDRWVVKTVLSMIKHGHLPLASNQVIAVNLSGLSVNDGEFLDYVRDLFRQYPEVPPGQICFEITETATIGNISSAQRFIKKLRKLGCRFALDDFGSGLSSFAYLKNLSIDFLKIEGSFVRDMLEDPVDMVVVEAVSLIGKRVDMTTIAEWVENDTILRAVRALEIDFAQGFGVHKPEIIEVAEGQSGLDPLMRTQEG